MPSLRDPSTRNSLIHRLQQLMPTTRPRWGKFDAPRMLCHLNDALAVSLGELSTTTMNKKAFQCFPLKHLVMYVVPFPKGAQAPPDMLVSVPEDFDVDRQRRRPTRPALRLSLTAYRMAVSTLLEHPARIPSP